MVSSSAKSPRRTRYLATAAFVVVHYYVGWWLMLAWAFLMFYGVGLFWAYPLALLVRTVWWLLWAPFAIAMTVPNTLSMQKIDMVRVVCTLLYASLFYRFHAALARSWRRMRR